MTAIAEPGAITFNCPDPESLADFYAQATGWQKLFSSETAAYLGGQNGMRMGFVKSEDFAAPSWPQADSRVHVDFSVADLDKAEAELLALGATKPAEQPGAGKWTVLLDPAGYPFCISRRGVRRRDHSSGAICRPAGPSGGMIVPFTAISAPAGRRCDKPMETEIAATLRMGQTRLSDVLGNAYGPRWHLGPHRVSIGAAGPAGGGGAIGRLYTFRQWTVHRDRATRRRTMLTCRYVTERHGRAIESGDGLLRGGAAICFDRHHE